MKNKIITILGGLLFLSITCNVWWLGSDRKYYQRLIVEMNEGAEVDHNYVNKMAQAQISAYNLWQSCNKTLAKDLKGEISTKELTQFMPEYSKQVDSLTAEYAELSKLKKERTELFATFGVAKVYNPNIK